MSIEPYRTAPLAEVGPEAQRPSLDADGVLSAIALFVAGAVALVSGLTTGSASEGGLGVALLVASLFMLRGELRAAGLRERCGRTATSRPR